MFDFDASKLLIVGAVALIFIPPKDLPRVLRQVGQFVGKMRRMASEFQGQFMDAMREADMADLREEARKLANAAKIDVGLGTVADLKSHLTGALEGKPVAAEAMASPLDPSRSIDIGQAPLIEGADVAHAEANDLRVSDPPSSHARGSDGDATDTRHHTASTEEASVSPSPALPSPAMSQSA